MINPITTVLKKKRKKKKKAKQCIALGKDVSYLHINKGKINETFRKCKSNLFFVLIYYYESLQ